MGESTFDRGERVFVDALLIIRIEDLAGDLGGGRGDEAAELALQLGGEALAVGLRGGFRLGEDLLGLGDRFLGFLLGECGNAFSGLVDQADGLVVGLGDCRGGGRFGLGELAFDALELLFALGDAGAALFKDCLNRPEGELLQDKDH